MIDCWIVSLYSVVPALIVQRFCVMLRTVLEVIEGVVNQVQPRICVKLVVPGSKTLLEARAPRWPPVHLNRTIPSFYWRLPKALTIAHLLIDGSCLCIFFLQCSAEQLRTRAPLDRAGLCTHFGIQRTQESNPSNKWLASREGGRRKWA